MEEQWCGSKEDKEKGNNHFVNLKSVMWVLWWLQKAAIIRHKHYKNAIYPMRPAESGKNTDETKSLNSHSKMLNISSIKILALDTSFSWRLTLRKGITILPACQIVFKAEALGYQELSEKTWQTTNESNTIANVEDVRYSNFNYVRLCLILSSEVIFTGIDSALSPEPSETQQR